MLFLLSACALITKSDYDWRTKVGPEDSGDSGDDHVIEISGSLDMLPDRSSRNALPRVTVGVVRFEFIFGAAETEPFMNVFELVDEALVEDLSPGVERPFKLGVPDAVPAEQEYDIQGMTGTTFMLVAYVDDGNGVIDPADTIVGGNSTDLLVHVVSGNASGFDEGPGWYLISIPDLDVGEIKDVYAIEQSFFVWDVESNLLPLNRTEEGVSGKVDAELPDGQVTVTLWNVEFFQELISGDPTDRAPWHGLAEAGADGRFEFQPIGMPAKESLSSISADGTDYSALGLVSAAYIALAWGDDGDQEFEYQGEERPFAYSANAGSDSKGLLWYEPVGVQAAFTLGYGREVGWNVLGAADDNQGEVLPWAENQLVLGDDGI
ncbi:MAG TPA: hypothetical protein QGF58_15660 [Myxococcota bacterium]|nr:hypothetical protein [Myxococcota bacterium]